MVVSAQQERLDAGEYVILGRVALTNNGNRNVKLDYSEGPFSVRLITFAKDGSRGFEQYPSQDAMGVSRIAVKGNRGTQLAIASCPRLASTSCPFKCHCRLEEMGGHLAAGGEPGRYLARIPC